ncbi:hypothetical protein C9374_003247 [Naegleria lovaniensis]|uniref:Uncharacterized protein n=1 Tax=Naegleria lovaniensis TaxID=51637 RepID=A0AA88GMJ9_NAELO|nr:uncharacterized protein C9374_003247 [Naegleria lovaniensis]KAG2385432.1 hypothetical protein C9374_003247 [Naegleria lovaniensis]
MPSETGNASLLLENLINVHTNINLSNLILVLKEILDTSSNNSVRIAALEQSFVTQTELRKQINNLKDDIKGSIGDSLKENQDLILDCVKKDIQTSVKSVVDREVSSITAEIIEHKTKYAEKIRQIDITMADHFKSMIDTTNKGDRKVTSVQQLVDRLEYRTIKLEDSVREYADNFKKLQNRLSRINQSLNKGNTAFGDNEINVDEGDTEGAEIIKKSENAAKKKRKSSKAKRKSTAETPNSGDNSSSTRVNNEGDASTPTATTTENKEPKSEEQQQPLIINKRITSLQDEATPETPTTQLTPLTETTDSPNSLIDQNSASFSDLNAPMRLQGDLTLTKIQTKVNELKDYVDSLKETLQHRIVTLKQDMREEFTVNIYNTKKELEDKINAKMDKKDVYHLLGFKANSKELEKIKSDYDFIMSMYAKLDKDLQQFKENPPANFMNFRQGSPLGFSTNNFPSGSLREENGSMQQRKSKSTTDDPLDINNRITSPNKERMPQLYGNSNFGAKMLAKNRTNKGNSGDSRPLTQQTLNALTIIDKLTQRSISALEFRNEGGPTPTTNGEPAVDGEVNLIGSDAKIYRFGNVDKKLLAANSNSPVQLSDSEEEFAQRTAAAYMGKAPTNLVTKEKQQINKNNNYPMTLSRLRNEVKELQQSELFK